MLNYIKADLFRILARGKRWILVGVVFFIDAIIFWPSAESGMTGVDNAEMIESVLKWLPLAIGFIEIMYVFGDDFRGKTAQIAIGVGIKRRHVVLAKWLEMIILAFLDTLLVVITGVVLCAFSAGAIPAELFGDLFVQTLMCVLAAAAYSAMVLPILFMSQGTTLSMLVYLLLSAGLIHKLMELIGRIKAISGLHLSNYTLTNCLNVLRSRLILGSLHFESLLGTLIYLGIFLFITDYFYRRLELEF